MAICLLRATKGHGHRSLYILQCHWSSLYSEHALFFWLLKSNFLRTGERLNLTSEQTSQEYMVSLQHNVLHKAFAPQVKEVMVPPSIPSKMIGFSTVLMVFLLALFCLVHVFLFASPVRLNFLKAGTLPPSGPS